MYPYLHMLISVVALSPIIVIRHDLVTFPRNDLGPTNSPLLRTPPAMIMYVTPHSNPLIVTVATPLAIEALPEMQVATNTARYNYVHYSKYIT